MTELQAGGGAQPLKAGSYTHLTRPTNTEAEA